MNSSTSVRGRVSPLVAWAVLTAGLGGGLVLSWKELTDAALGREHDHDGLASMPSTEGPVRFYCPMHPSYHSQGPLDCPLCNMDMVPMDAGEVLEIPTVAGHATVRLAPSRQQLIGIRTAEVTGQRCSTRLRLPARVELDEEGITDISLKTSGWIEDLYVRWEGAEVEQGQPLFTLYSSEMYEAQRKYILAQALLEQSLAAGGSEIEASRRQSIELNRARLALWDLTDEQVAALQDPAAEPQSVTTIVARESGVVTLCRAVRGARVDPGAPLYQLADLSTVWVMAEVFESDLPRIRPGAPAILEVDSRPGETIEAQVDYVYPILDARTRTARVRFVVDNLLGDLSPGMYATASIQIDLGESLVVEAGALLDSGLRKLVFVELGEGEFEPREVVVGGRFDDRVLIAEGLEEGERVVTSGTFLIDSESRLQAALTSFAGEDAEGTGHEE